MSDTQVDKELNELRAVGDAEAYDRARDEAMDAAIIRGDDYETERISRTHAPFGFEPATPAPLPGSTEQEAIELAEIFENPDYMEEMKATDGDPQKMAKVYNAYGVPQHARLEAGASNG